MMLRLLALCLLLSSCSVYPYAEVGLGVVRDRSTSYVLRPECNYVMLGTDEKPCGGSNPVVHIRFGVEFAEDAWLDRCEYAHESHLRDGTPFNDRPETYSDQGACFKRWGGNKRSFRF